MPRKKKLAETPADKEAIIQKGVSDGSWGPQLSNNAVAPKAVKNMVASLKPIEAYELCSAVRSAVRARNEPFGQVVIRLFTRSGKEITSGDNYNFWQKPNGFQGGNSFIQAIASWLDLSGERIAWVHDAEGRTEAHVLNPFSLSCWKPTRPRLPEEIIEWKYTWENGDFFSINADEIVFEHDFNPSSQVRGNSPLIAVVNSITASYQAQRYVKSFFSNNATPGGIISLETDNDDLVEPFKKEFLSQHAGEASAFKLWFTAFQGKVNFTPLSAPLNEAPFQQLISNVQSEVASLYMVPPLHSGQWDKTRFDSVSEQNNFFYESVWLPRLQTIQGFCQNLQDNHLRFKTNTGSKNAVLSKSMQSKLEKARSDSLSDVLVVLDSDHIPAVSKLKMQKVDYAQKLQDVFHITPAESASEVGLDLQLNEASNMVWYNSNQKFVEHVKADTIPETPESVSENTNNDASTPNNPSVAQDVEETDPAQQDAAEQVKSFYRSLRKLSLSCLDTGKIWSLKQVDSLAKEYSCEEYVHIEIRKDYAAIVIALKTKDKEAIKSYFNGKKPSYYRSLVKSEK